MEASEPAWTVIIPDAVRADMERKLILIDEVTVVIAAAETGGQRLKDKKSGHFIATLRTGPVTTWVEYENTEAGALVHRAYGHRMDVKAEETS